MTCELGQGTGDRQETCLVTKRVSHGPIVASSASYKGYTIYTKIKQLLV